MRITDGRIVEVLEEAGDAPHTERIDAGSAYVLPGVIDPHVHALSDPREGIAAATRAAAAVVEPVTTTCALAAVVVRRPAGASRPAGLAPSAPLPRILRSVPGDTHHEPDR